MITRHGPVVATEIQDSAVSTAKIAATAVTAAKVAPSAVTATKIAASAVISTKINSTALNLHIARGTKSGTLATAGEVAVDTGLTSPVVAFANIIGSGTNAGKNCRVGLGRFSGAYAIFSLMSKLAGSAAQAYVAAGSAVSRSVSWAAWET